MISIKATRAAEAVWQRIPKISQLSIVLDNSLTEVREYFFKIDGKRKEEDHDRKFPHCVHVVSKKRHGNVG